MNDLISRQDAIDALCQVDEYNSLSMSAIKHLPSAQPETTLESAIDYLHSIGWMQEHDKALTESAQPERKPIIRCWCPKCGFEMIPTIDSEMKGDE